MPSSAGEPYAEGAHLVATARVTLRAEPSVRASRLGTLRVDEMVSVSKRSEQSFELQERRAYWYRVERRGGMRGWVYGAYLAPDTGTLMGQSRSGSMTGFEPIDTHLIAGLLAARKFVVPERFKALVIRIDPVSGSEASRFYPFSYKDTYLHRENWWPASTVKLFAAIAALEKSRRLGIEPGAKLTFDYTTEVSPEPVTKPLNYLVRRALIQSNNQAFDQLVEWVGFHTLNDRFLTAGNGLAQTTLLRAYTRRHMYPELNRGSNRLSPPITVAAKGRVMKLPSERGDGAYNCPNQGNCTTLWDLAEALRRVMLHESLPAAERFALGADELRLLRKALGTRRSRGNPVVDALRNAFGDRIVGLYHKPGYAGKWMSDVVFVDLGPAQAGWLVALANDPGRSSLDEGASHVAALMASGALDVPDTKAP